jgi:hypothetical protein
MCVVCCQKLSLSLLLVCLFLFRFREASKKMVPAREKTNGRSSCTGPPTSSSLDTLGQFYVDVKLNRSLRVHHYKISLPKGLWENLVKDYHKPDCKPSKTGAYVSKWFIPYTCFPPFRFSLALCLITTFVVKSCLRRIAQMECKLVHCLKHLLTWLVSSACYQHVHLPSWLRIGKLLCIWLLSKCLVVVHDVTHHLSVECDWIPHSTVL